MFTRLLQSSCLLVLLCGVATAQLGQFVEASQYTVGKSPLAAVSGDLNGDGKLDLAVTNKVDGSVSVLLGNGDGTFQPKVDYIFYSQGMGQPPFTAALGDLNRDGDLDLVVTLPNANQVAVLLGKGDGTLQPPSYYDTGEGPQSVAIKDLDGKNGADLIVTNAGVPGTPANSMSVLMNSGTGTFLTHVEYATGIAPMGLITAHFTSSNTWDVAVTNSLDGAPTNPGTVSIMMGNGDGTFQTHRDFTVGFQPQVIAAADLNHDSVTDLVIGNFNDKTVSVLMGTGGGHFKAQRTFATAFEEPNGIAIADFNGDGNPDLAVSNAGADSVSILLGNGDGTFQPHADYWAGNGPVLLTAADFNNDLNIDLAVPNAGWSTRPDDKVSVLLGNGDGTFRSHPLYETGVLPAAVQSGDFNGDGKTDVVVINTGEAGCFCHSIGVLLGNGDGTYQPRANYATGLFPVAVALGDFDNDGNPDIVAANYGTDIVPDNTVSVFMGNGDGSFQLQVPHQTGNNPAAVAAADINEDGKLDLIVANSADNTVSALLGNGNGSFQSQTTYPVSSSPRALAVGDLNADGIPDLVIALPKTNSLGTLLGRSDGTFHPAVYFTTAAEPVSITLAHFNHDGKLDAATANRTGLSMSVLMGNGHGTLQAAVNYSAADPVAIVAGDLNGDTITDLLVANQSDNTATLFTGLGDGTFVLPAAFGTGWLPSSLALADLNGDSAIDILSANSAPGSVSAILNAAGTFVTLASSPANPTYGEAITLTITAAASLPWKPAPAGNVNFLDSAAVLGAANLSGGTATFTLATLSAGTHSLSARYLGDTNFQPHTTSTATQKVNKASTVTGLTSSANPSAGSQVVTFTATVAPEYSGTPSGTVTFLDGTATMGTGSLKAGVASFASSTLSPGTHNIAASYGGDPNFTPSVSPAMAQIVNAQDFSMAASPFSGPMHAGESANSTLTITALSGFSGSVTLTCSVTPSPTRAPTCLLNPASVTASPAGATSTLTVSTTAPQSASVVRPHASRQQGPIYALLLPMASYVFLGFGLNRRRKRMLVLLACLFVAALVFLVGCGGGSSSSPAPTATPGTPAGTYTVTITGTSGSGSSGVTHQTAVTVTVQ